LVWAFPGPGSCNALSKGAALSQLSIYDNECWSRLREEINAETNPQMLPAIVAEINQLLDSVAERMAELTTKASPPPTVLLAN
jgi:hypothetical protein